MMLRVLAVSMIGLSLAGCVNNSGLSGDVYSASEAKQVQAEVRKYVKHLVIWLSSIILKNEILHITQNK